METWLAWLKVKAEVDGGTLGPEFEKRELDSLGEQIKKAEEDAKEEVQGSYRFVSLYDPQAESRLKTIDMGAGYANGNESLTGRVISALKQNGLLSESVGAGYIGRNWPPAFKGHRGMAPERAETEFLGRVPDKTAGYRQCPQTKTR